MLVKIIIIDRGINVNDNGGEKKKYMKNKK